MSQETKLPVPGGQEIYCEHRFLRRRYYRVTAFRRALITGISLKLEGAVGPSSSPPAVNEWWIFSTIRRIGTAEDFKRAGIDVRKEVRNRA